MCSAEVKKTTPPGVNNQNPPGRVQPHTQDYCAIEKDDVKEAGDVIFPQNL